MDPPKHMDKTTKEDLASLGKSQMHIFQQTLTLKERPKKTKALAVFPNGIPIGMALRS